MRTHARYLLGLLLGLGLQHVSAEAASQRLLVWIPQSEEQTSAALRVLDRYPRLRFVWAVSPRFFRSAKGAELRGKLTDLEHAGRIALALQIPNAPFLPLLINTAEAKTAVPAGTVLPSPPYASSDDVMQHLIRAKAQFFTQWGRAPEGIIFPYGAFSAELGGMVQNQGWRWGIAALGISSSTASSYALSSFMNLKNVTLWDGAQPVSPLASPQVLVWDEREQKGPGGIKTLEAWAKTLDREKSISILPGDAGLPEPQKLEGAAWSRRTWTQSDWSAWIGTPEKNAVWNALATTREALNAYQNSGQAQLGRLDAAVEEFLTAENGSFMLFAGSATLSDIEREDRTRDFVSTLETVYRLTGAAAPENLLRAGSAQGGAASAALPLMASEKLPDGRERMHVSDAQLSLEIVASSDTLSWTVSGSSAMPDATLDIYIDINGLENVGLTSLLPGRALTVRPEDAWEYALSVTGNHAVLYRTQGANTFTAAGTFAAARQEHSWAAVVPRAEMRGNWKRWGYKVLILDKELRVLHILERKYQ